MVSGAGEALVSATGLDFISAAGGALGMDSAAAADGGLGLVSEAAEMLTATESRF